MSKDDFIKYLLELKTLNDDQTDDFDTLILTIYNSLDLSPEEKFEIFSFGFSDELASGNYDWLETFRYYFEEYAILCDLSNFILVDKNFEIVAERWYLTFLTRIINKAIKDSKFKNRMFDDFNKIKDYNDHLLFLKSLKLIIKFKPRLSEIALDLVNHLKLNDLIDNLKIENPYPE